MTSTRKKLEWIWMKHAQRIMKLFCNHSVINTNILNFRLNLTYKQCNFHWQKNILYSNIKTENHNKYWLAYEFHYWKSNVSIEFPSNILHFIEEKYFPRKFNCFDISWRDINLFKMDDTSFFKAKLKMADAKKTYRFFFFFHAAGHLWNSTIYSRMFWQIW